MKAAYGKEGDWARMQSKPLHSRWRSCLVFWYYAYGIDVGTLSVFWQQGFVEERTIRIVGGYDAPI